MKHINEYFSQSEKISLISEYLLSKNKHMKIETINKDMRLKDVCKTLENLSYVKYDKELKDLNEIVSVFDLEGPERIYNAQLTERGEEKSKLIIVNKAFKDENRKFIYISYYNDKFTWAFSCTDQGFDKEIYAGDFDLINKYINS